MTTPTGPPGTSPHPEPGTLAALWGHIESVVRYPESVLGLLLYSVWAVLAGLWTGWIGIVLLLIIGWLLHAGAVESGNHVMLWLSTAVLLTYVVVASEASFGGLPPAVLAVAGTTVLAHNELVRIGYGRRRRAVLHEQVFQASSLALVLCGALAVLAVAITDLVNQGSERSWLWMVAAVAMLFALGLALAIAPSFASNDASRKRWRPGARIPPQPLPQSDLPPHEPSSTSVATRHPSR